MTYIDKGPKAFLIGPRKIIQPIRSEARLKNYSSVIDTRAWCDIIEERRQYILEYSAKNKGGFCLDQFIPLEIIFKIMLAGRNLEIKKLRKKLKCLQRCMALYSKIKLTPEQKNQLKILRTEMENVYGACKRQGFGDNADVICPCSTKRQPPQENSTTSRWYATGNEILKKCQQKMLYIPFPTFSNNCSMEKIKKCKSQVTITYATRDICTETDNMRKINNCPKFKRCRSTCSNTIPVCCKDKIVETDNELITLMARRDQLQCVASETATSGVNTNSVYYENKRIETECGYVGLDDRQSQLHCVRSKNLCCDASTNSFECINKLIESESDCTKLTNRLNQIKCIYDQNVCCDVNANSTHRKHKLISPGKERLIAARPDKLNSIIQTSVSDLCCPEEEVEVACHECSLLNKEDMDVCLNNTAECEKNECHKMVVLDRKPKSTCFESSGNLKMVNEIASAAHEQLQNIFSQSQCVQRISKELEKQYQQWNQLRCDSSSEIIAEVNFRCHCNVQNYELTDSDGSINLEQELDDIEKEREKLIELVQEIQRGSFSNCLQDCLKSDNIKLQEQLQREMIYRKYLEQKMLSVLN